MNSFIYGTLSFRVYDQSVLVWTPSGSCPLCLTPPCYQLQKPPLWGGSFFDFTAFYMLPGVALSVRAVQMTRIPSLGNHKRSCCWTRDRSRAMICSSYRRG